MSAENCYTRLINRLRRDAVRAGAMTMADCDALQWYMERIERENAAYRAEIAVLEAQLNGGAHVG